MRLSYNSGVSERSCKVLEDSSILYTLNVAYAGNVISGAAFRLFTSGII